MLQSVDEPSLAAQKRSILEELCRLKTQEVQSVALVTSRGVIDALTDFQIGNSESLKCTFDGTALTVVDTVDAPALRESQGPTPQYRHGRGGAGVLIHSEGDSTMDSTVLLQERAASVMDARQWAGPGGGVPDPDGVTRNCQTNKLRQAVTDDECLTTAKKSWTRSASTGEQHQSGLRS